MTFGGEVDFDEVLAGARCGDESSWASLYDSLAPQLLGYLRLRGARDAEEVLGDVFLHVARGIDAFVGESSKFRSWVFVIATSRLQDERRRGRRKPTEPLDPTVEERLHGVDDVQAAVELAEVAREVRRLLSCLTPDQRRVVELRVFAGLASQEVAEVLDKPVGAVKALYRRGLAALRRELDTLDVDRETSILPLPSPAVPLRGAAAVTQRS